jgi:hypothetical protein
MYSRIPLSVSTITSRLQLKMRRPVSEESWLALQALSILYPTCKRRQDLRENIFMLIAIRPKSSFNEVDSYSFVLNTFVSEVKNVQRWQSPGGGSSTAKAILQTAATTQSCTLWSMASYSPMQSAAQPSSEPMPTSIIPCSPPELILEQSLLPSQWTLRTI